MSAPHPASPQARHEVVLGVLGGSGLYAIDGLENVREVELDTPFGRPSGPFTVGQLERLVLHATKLSDEGARLLFGAETVRALRTLHLSQCALSERATLQALAASPLTELRELSLSGNNALGGQLDALAGWSVLGQLESLALPQSATLEDLQALYPEPSPMLRALHLSTAKALLVR